MFETLLGFINNDPATAREYALDNELLDYAGDGRWVPTKPFLLMAASAATNDDPIQRDQLHRLLLWAAEIND